MKILKNVFSYIIMTFLAVLLSFLLIANLLSSTILSKDYILDKLNQTDYYNKVYNYVESNFEKYIYQSGLDESVIKNIITVEQIREDTQSIIENIYDNAKKEIKVEEVKQNLIDNIEESLGKSIDNQKSSVETFAQTIADEYVNSVSHYDYEEKINDIYIQVLEIISKGKQISLILIVVSIILLFILNIKSIYDFLINIEISILASGIFLECTKLFINSKINIENINILNIAISETLKNILLQILNELSKYGRMFSIIGILLIIVSTYIYHYNEKNKNLDEKR